MENDYMRDPRKFFRIKFKLDRFEVSVISIAMISFIIIGSVFFFYYFHFPKLTEDNENWAHFGDFVGGTLSSVFSFFTFLAILYTLHLQRQELKLNRDELVANRKELIISNELATNQLNNAIRQKNEDFLISYLKIYSEREIFLRNSSFSTIGSALLEDFSSGSLMLPSVNGVITNKDKTLKTNSILRYLYCLEYLIFWDLNEYRSETGLEIPTQNHLHFSSSYSIIIKSFCTDETFSSLKRSNILSKMKIGDQFPNITRFIKSPNF